MVELQQLALNRIVLIIPAYAANARPRSSFFCCLVKNMKKFRRCGSGGAFWLSCSINRRLIIDFFLIFRFDRRRIGRGAGRGRTSLRSDDCRSGRSGPSGSLVSQRQRIANLQVKRFLALNRQSAGDDFGEFSQPQN